MHGRINIFLVTTNECQYQESNKKSNLLLCVSLSPIKNEDGGQMSHANRSDKILQWGWIGNWAE